jgi:hypothetical protein
LGNFNGKWEKVKVELEQIQWHIIITESCRESGKKISAPQLLVWLRYSTAVKRVIFGVKMGNWGDYLLLGI